MNIKYLGNNKNGKWLMPPLKKNLIFQIVLWVKRKDELSK